MTKILRGVIVSCIIGTLATTSAFANSVSPDITAFEGIPSTQVSIEEQASVSGDGVFMIWVLSPVGKWVLKRIAAATIGAALNKINCGTWSTCKVK